MGPLLTVKGTVPKYPLEVGAAESLAAMTPAYVFFSPAIIYIHGRFGDLLLADMMREIGRDVRIYFKRFNSRIFSGLESSRGDPAWNYALLAVTADDWQLLTDFICSACVRDKATDIDYRYGEQRLMICDPLFADRNGGDRSKSLVVPCFGTYWHDKDRGMLRQVGLVAADDNVPQLVYTASPTETDNGPANRS